MENLVILLLVLAAMGTAKPDVRSVHRFDKLESKFTSHSLDEFDRSNFIQYEFKSKPLNNYRAPAKSLLVNAGLCNPLATPDCFNEQFGFCIEDFDYPEDQLLSAMEKKPALVARFLHKDDDDHHDTSVNLKTNRQLEEENTCPAMLMHVNPIRAENIDGHWRVIVQDLKGVHQRERIIMCLDTESICGHIDYEQCHISRCSQQLRRRRLLAYDPCHPERGIFVDVFHFQSGCSCHNSPAFPYC